jgi:hypothetical protein
VAVYDSTPYGGQSGWFQVGGTSASAPAWAGLIAITNQGLATGSKGPLSGTQAQSDLYSLPSSDFHDITTGNNGYAATRGYDLVTGIGTPQANVVVAGVLKINGVSEAPVSAQLTVSTTTKATQTTSTHLDLTSSSSSNSGTTGGSSSSLGTSTISVGPVAATLLAGSGNTQSTASLAIQALGTPATTTSAQPAAAQAPASSPVSQSTASPAPLGQSLLPQISYMSRSIAVEKDPETVVTTDETAPSPSAPPVPSIPPAEETAPAPLDEDLPQPDPGQMAEPPANPAQPVDDLATDSFDLALDQVSVSMAARRLDLPPARLSDLQPASEERPVVSLSALAGTAVLAAGGYYRLILGRSDRIRRRWSSLRFI